MPAIALLLLAALLLPLARAYTPCRAPYDTAAAAGFETPCFDTLHAAGALEVRRYPSLAPAHARTAQVVHVNLTGVVTDYAEAVLNGVEFLFCYFQGACSVSHTSAAASRTVPLLVRPPQRAGDRNWAIDMAMAPSLWPGPVPAGENGINILPLDALVAARHCTARAAPVEADFKACAAALEDEAPALKAAGFVIDGGGEWTPAYAYYSLQNQTAPPFDIEAWVSVKRV